MSLTTRTVPCVVSVAEHAGWAHLVCVAVSEGLPVVIARRRATLIDAGLPPMPYHHDTLAMRADKADALIARVRRSITACSSLSLKRVADELAPAHAVVALAIRQPPFPELPASVTDVRQSYRLQCAADGMMYQLALCRAAEQLGVEVHQYRRGEEVAMAAERLAVTPRTIESFVSRTGRPAGAPWTQEHRQAFAAGIAAIAMHTPTKVRIPSASRR